MKAVTVRVMVYSGERRELGKSANRRGAQGRVQKGSHLRFSIVFSWWTLGWCHLLAGMMCENTCTVSPTGGGHLSLGVWRCISWLSMSLQSLLEAVSFGSSDYAFGSCAETKVSNVSHIVVYTTWSRAGGQGRGSRQGPGSHHTGATRPDLSLGQVSSLS